jgi:hypothetical protein
VVGEVLTVGATTIDAAKFDILGDIDLAWVGARNRYDVLATGLVAKWDAIFGALRSYRLDLNADRTVSIVWSVDGTAELSMTSDASAPDPGTLNPIGVRAFLDVDSGGGNRSATFSISQDLGVTWTQLGNVISTAGVTSIFNSGAGVTVGGHSGIASVAGQHYQAWIRNSAGALVANPRFIDQPPRQPSFTDDQANLWVLGPSALIGVI